MAQPAVVSSSSSFTSEWTYDVFISFRGKDTRDYFTGHLYKSLVRKGIHAFIDNKELGKGEQIRPALLGAIQESRIAIIVFSENYAESTFCLDELVEILEHLKAKGRLVWPIFYDVDPSDVRHQRGSYAGALAELEERFRDDKGKVQKWRDALREAADLSGSHFKRGSENECNFIDIIVSEVFKKLNRTPFHVADNPVGLDSPVLKVKSLIGLGSNDRVDMVGIWGIGGIGKTTIARAAYNSFVDQFDGSCFLADVREDTSKHGLAHLQGTLLSEILGEDIKIRDVNKGISLIKRRLQRKKILLILDDVDDQEQLRALAGGHDWFGWGSRIIITSRDRHLLCAHGVKKFYEVKELNKKDALELFSWKAFGSNRVDPIYADVLSRALSCVGGLPLALEVIGSNLYNRSIDEWNSALDKYESIPHDKVNEILMISYVGLHEDEKNIFLDIACFFNTYERSYVNQMMHARGFHPEHSIEVLIDRSLMKIDGRNGRVIMHDLIRDMGREIVRRESILEPGKRSRLWSDEDIVNVLQNDMGTAKVEVIILKSSKHKEVRWNGKAFKEMRNLRVLIVEDVHFSTSPEHLPNSLRVLDWSGYPSPSLPCDFHPNDLLILSLPNSCLKLDKPLKMFGSLGFMDFESCKFLRRVPDLSGFPNLRALCLDNCTNLTEVDESIGSLDKLILLSAQGCIKLQTLVPAINLPSLETLDLRWCTSLESFPEVLGIMENIQEVYLDETAIEELPDSIGNLVALERLYLRSCTKLKQLPSTVRLLSKLEVMFFHMHRGFRLYDPCKEQEGVISEIFIYPPPDVHDSGGITSTLSAIRSSRRPNFRPASRGLRSTLFREPRPLNWGSIAEGRMIERNGSSVSFRYRRTFPKVTLWPIWDPIGMEVHGSVSEFSICVLINGTFRFSPSCLYIFHETETREPAGWSWIEVSLFDLLCRIPEDVFSLNEWNHVEVSCELKHRMAYDPKWVCEGHDRSITRTINHSIIHLCRRSSCMMDFKFTDSDRGDIGWCECCDCEDMRALLNRLSHVRKDAVVVELLFGPTI